MDSRTLLLFVYVLSIALVASAATCRGPQPVNPAFCLSPPVVRRFNLSSISGKWYGLFSTGFATTTSTQQCITSNYTLSSDGTAARVLNCQIRPDNPNRPSCLQGLVTRRSNSSPQSRVQISFVPSQPAIPYNVVATLGNPSYGYYLAVFYVCTVRTAADGSKQSSPSFAIVARSPWAPRFALGRVIKRLRCAGFMVKYEDFVEVKHPPSCVYAGLPGSFDVDQPRGIAP